jgi:hypothetical protein
MRLTIFLTLFSFLFSFTALAIPAGKIVCDIPNEYCRYAPLHWGDSQIASKVTQIMSKDLDYLASAKHFIYPDNNLNEVAFWVDPDVKTTCVKNPVSTNPDTCTTTEDFKLLNKMKSIIIDYDKKINVLDKDQIRVQVEIVSISNQGMRSFSAGLADKGVDEAKKHLGGGVLNLAFSGPASWVKTFLGIEKSKEEAGDVTGVDLTVGDGESIDSRKQVDIFYSPNAAKVELRTVGAQIRGQFRIDADDPTKVLLTGFNFNLGRLSGIAHPDGNNAVETIRHPDPYLVLYSGQTNILFQHNSSRYVNKKSGRLFGIEREKIKIKEKLMLLITVQTISKEDLKKEREDNLKKLADMVFSQSEKSNLPADGVSMAVLLESLKFHSQLLSNGDFLLWGTLDQNLATKEHLNKVIEIGFDIKGEKRTDLITVEKLMKGGVVIETKQEWFADPSLKIKMNLKPWGGRKREKVKYETNYLVKQKIFFQ